MVFKRYGGGLPGGNSANTRFIEVRAFSLWLAVLIGAAGTMLESRGFLIVMLMLSFPFYYGLGLLAEKIPTLAFSGIILFSFALVVSLLINTDRIVEAEYLESRISIHFFIEYSLLMAATAIFCIFRLKFATKVIAEKTMYGMSIAVLLSTVAILVITALNTSPILTWDKTLELSRRVSSGEHEAFLETLQFAEENLMSAAKTEDLMVVAGKYASIEPEKYLMAINDWQKDNAITRRFGCIGVANLGESFVDKIDEIAAEISLRKYKIESVSADDLNTIKTICLKELNDLEKTLKNN